MNKFKPVITSVSFSKYNYFYENLEKRYEIKETLSVSNIMHMKNTAEQTNEERHISLTVINKYKNALFSFLLKKSEQIKLKKEDDFTFSAVTLESLLNTNNSLNELINALWRVYQSNNLQLSQSFRRLIHTIAEQGAVWREIISSTEIIRNLDGAGKIFISQLKRIETFLPFFDIIRRDMKVRNILSVKPVYTETAHISENIKISERTAFKIYNHYKDFNRITNLLSANSGIAPALEQIYETLEANSLFYNSSVYRSNRTLYRLTNSLWKVYNSQNLELSRNFTRLINTITEKNIAVKHQKNVSEIFTSTQSLSNLIYALRRAFSGNNLQMRHSLINLFKEINEAGQANINTPVNNNFLLLYRLFISSEKSTGRMDFRHPDLIQPKKISEFSPEKTEELFYKKLKSIRPETKSETLNTEKMIREITDKIKNEQKEQWRYEKLQRGML